MPDRPAQGSHDGHTCRGGPDALGLAALRVGVMYESPWERLVTWLDGIDRKTLELKFEVREHSLRGRLSAFCDTRDAAWRARWVVRGRNPPARWKRRV